MLHSSATHLLVYLNLSQEKYNLGHFLGTSLSILTQTRLSLPLLVSIQLYLTIFSKHAFADDDDDNDYIIIIIITDRK